MAVSVLLNLGIVKVKTLVIVEDKIQRNNNMIHLVHSYLLLSLTSLCINVDIIENPHIAMNNT